MAFGAWQVAWEKAVGSDLAGATRVSGFRAGTLTIDVGSSALRYELESFRAGDLLAALQADETVKGVTRLRFRVTNLPTDTGRGLDSDKA